jgi:hypothetical protein
MIGLHEIAGRMKRHNCEMLVKRTANEITYSGAGIGVGDIKVDIGDFSNKFIELVQATEVAISIDNSQYLLCKEVLAMKDNDPSKNDYKKIRLQLMMAFNQLQGILGAMREQPTVELKKELANWVKYMGELNKQSITFLQPGARMVQKGTKSKLKQIMKYQGLHDNELNEAVKEM